ncbi:MAG: prepilin-type N-terminal cleavage/methylation domain-containing protein [Cytophagales bacterium]|nr:prepilin-type N-terminal cleavage/methylation domain-containing protein [Cytophagales bacterium]
MKRRIARGFTLVELAIVLVIFTLVVTGVLRGQELINSAKARHIIDQKSSIQTAYLGFSNRYQLMSGDLTAAQASFVGSGVVASTTSGSVVSGDGRIDINSESVLVFQNLTATSFLSCASCMSVTGNAAATTGNSPINSYSQSLQFGTVAASATGVYWYDKLTTAMPDRNVLTTGSKVTAAILQQVDQKADDGVPYTGLFRQSTSDGADTTANCAGMTVPGVVANTWTSTGNANCAGAWLF